MIKYHKIQTVFKRDGGGRLLHGEWTTPEFEYLKSNTRISKRSKNDH